MFLLLRKKTLTREKNSKTSNLFRFLGLRKCYAFLVWYLVLWTELIKNRALSCPESRSWPRGPKLSPSRGWSRLGWKGDNLPDFEDSLFLNSSLFVQFHTRHQSSLTLQVACTLQGNHLGLHYRQISSSSSFLLLLDHGSFFFIFHT